MPPPSCLTPLVTFSYSLGLHSIRKQEHIGPLPQTLLLGGLSLGRSITSPILTGNTAALDTGCPALPLQLTPYLQLHDESTGCE